MAEEVETLHLIMRGDAEAAKLLASDIIHTCVEVKEECAKLWMGRSMAGMRRKTRTFTLMRDWTHEVGFPWVWGTLGVRKAASDEESE